jgi:hypothetical protein
VAALVAAIYDFGALQQCKSWMAGPSSAMTLQERSGDLFRRKLALMGAGPPSTPLPKSLLSLTG